MNYKDTLTYKDISEIPKLLNNFRFNIKVKDLCRYREVYLLGRGSSGNATLFAKYVWEIYCGVMSNIVHPFSIFNLKRKMDFSQKLLFSFSQSGRSFDIVKCSRIIGNMGGKIVAITNEPNLAKNELFKISDWHILLSNSKEIPVAATKSFVLQLWFVLKMAEVFSANFGEERFKKTIRNVEYVISNFEKMNLKLDLIIKSQIVGFVGRGPFNAIAEDSALKLREMAQIHSLGYSAAEFLHGPVGSYTPKDFVIILAKEKKLTKDLVLVENKLKEKKVKYMVLCPFSNDYPFSVIDLDVFIKLIVLKLSVKKGLDPDNPKGLSKVTYTV